MTPAAVLGVAAAGGGKGGALTKGVSGFSKRISPDFGGPASTFSNSGTYRKTGSATTDIDIGFNNTGGTVKVEAGSLTPTGLKQLRWHHAGRRHVQSDRPGHAAVHRRQCGDEVWLVRTGP